MVTIVTGIIATISLICILGMRHKQIQRKIIIIPWVLIILSLLLPYRLILSFKTPTSAFKAFNPLSKVLISIEQKDSAFLIAEDNNGNPAYVLKKENNKWKLPFASTSSELIYSEVEKVIRYYKEPNSNGIYLMIATTDSVDISDTANTVFMEYKDKYRAICVGYVENPNKDYKLFVDGEEYFDIMSNE
jgi:hypothetical protein